MPKDTSLSLEQTLPPAGMQQIRLVGERELRVVHRRGRRDLDYAFDVLALAPRGRVRLAIPWRWLVLALGALLLITLNHLWLFARFGATAGWIVTGLAAFTTLLALYRTVQCIMWQRLFVTRIARVPVLCLAINRPTRKQYRRFVTGLCQRIESLDESINLPIEQRMAGELKMLRRLSRRGVITAETYERAKKRLLGG